MRQLRNSVTAAYGSGVDAALYLQKFVHVTVHLDSMSRENTERELKIFSNHLANQLGLSEHDRDLVSYIGRIIVPLSIEKGYKFRTIEHLYAQIALCLAYSPKNMLRPAPIIIGLCILRMFYPEIYDKAKGGTLKYEEIRVILSTSALSSIYGYDEWWQYCTNEGLSMEVKERFEQALWSSNISNRYDVIPYVIESVIERVRQ